MISHDFDSNFRWRSNIFSGDPDEYYVFDVCSLLVVMALCCVNIEMWSVFQADAGPSHGDGAPNGTSATAIFMQEDEEEPVSSLYFLYNFT